MPTSGGISHHLQSSAGTCIAHHAPATRLLPRWFTHTLTGPLIRILLSSSTIRRADYTMAAAAAPISSSSAPSSRITA